MIIRPARWPDHPQLVPIVDAFAAEHHRMDHAFRDRWLGFTMAIFQTWLGEPDDLHLVAEIDGRIAGYAWIGFGRGSTGIYLFMRRNVFVYVLAVDAAARRRGIGTALLTAIEERARAFNAEIMQLSVVTANETAKRLYRRAGYQLTSETMTKTLETVRRLET